MNTLDIRDTAAIAERREKFKRRAKLLIQSDLAPVLRSFPPQMRRSVFAEVRPLLKFDAVYPEEDLNDGHE